MTDEEKAEEKYQEHINKEDCYVSKSEEEIYTDGFFDGLAEGKPKWHDLRKNPDDLPKGDEDCLCLVSECYFVGHYVKEDKEWHFDEFISSDVIAWCELPNFEE